MPKAEYPESVQNLSKSKYDQWTSVYHSARDDGDSKETAAKKAWGAVNKSESLENDLKLLGQSLREVSGDPDIQRSSGSSAQHAKPGDPLAPFPLSRSAEKQWHKVYNKEIEAGSGKREARGKAWDAVTGWNIPSVKKKREKMKEMGWSRRAIQNPMQRFGVDPEKEAEKGYDPAGELEMTYNEWEELRRKNPKLYTKLTGLNPELEEHALPWKQLKEVLDDEDIGPRELKLYIENDGELYRQKTQPIMKNLARKMAKGVYDHVKAIKLWMYLVDDGAKKYIQEFGGPDDKWHKVFTKPERWKVAKELAEEFEDAIHNDELDIDELADYKKPAGLEETMMFFGQDMPDTRKISELETMMTEIGLSYREMLEDVIDVLGKRTFEEVIKSLRKKYSYKQ